MAAPSQQKRTTRALRDAPLIDSSGAWAKEARMMASDRAQASGLPQRRDEYWKYTRPDAFVQADVTLHASQRSSLVCSTNAPQFRSHLKTGKFRQRRFPARPIARSRACPLLLI
jgi:hypothetical protein